MHTTVVRRVVLSALLGVTVAVAMAIPVVGQTSGVKENYEAIAVNMGSGPAAMGTVLVNVERWSTPKERETLLTTLVAKGPEKLLDVLQDMQKVGYIRLPNTLAWDLRYAYQSPLPEGGRRVVLGTDRPIGFQEARNQPRSIDYPFTLIEIHFDKNGVGVGKMSVATKISMSKDKQTMELENFGIEPVRLTEVHIVK